jgi:hypothetical protein
VPAGQQFLGDQAPERVPDDDRLGLVLAIGGIDQLDLVVDDLADAGAETS